MKIRQTTDTIIRKFGKKNTLVSLVLSGLMILTSCNDSSEKEEAPQPTAEELLKLQEKEQERERSRESARRHTAAQKAALKVYEEDVDELLQGTEEVIMRIHDTYYKKQKVDRVDLLHIQHINETFFQLCFEAYGDERALVFQMSACEFEKTGSDSFNWIIKPTRRGGHTEDLKIFSDGKRLDSPNVSDYIEIEITSVTPNIHRRLMEYLDMIKTHYYYIGSKSKKDLH